MRDFDQLFPGSVVDRHAVLLAVGAALPLRLARCQHFGDSGLRPGRFHPADEGLHLVLEHRRPPIASGSIMIDSMLLMIAVPSFLMVRGLCVRPPVSAPASRSQIIASPPPLCRPNGRMAP